MTTTTVQLLGLAGSLRKGSMNRGLLDAVGELLPPEATWTLFDRLREIPPFDPDQTSEPEPVTALREALLRADGLVLASPEYNYSVPGALKNAIDWASRPPPSSPLRRIPVGLVSASAGMSGGMRAQYHLRQIFVFMDAPVMAQPEVLIPRGGERFASDGKLVDESTRELVRKFGASFVEWTRRHARPRASGATP